MFGFGKAAPFDRDETFRRAEEFRGRKKPKKAIAELRKVLAVDPKDVIAHAKLGPLLISTGRQTEALESFRIAADDLDARGFSDKALSLWLQIAQTKVNDLDAWEKVSQFHLTRGRKAEGVKVLLQAASVQEGKVHRPGAIRLLESALVLEPHRIEAILSLAPLLKKEGRGSDARAARRCAHLRDGRGAQGGEAEAVLPLPRLPHVLELAPFVKMSPSPCASGRTSRTSLRDGRGAQGRS